MVVEGRNEDYEASHQGGGRPAGAASGSGRSRTSHAREAAKAAAAAKAALAPGAALQLRRAESDSTVAVIARALKAQWPALRDGDESGLGADYLGASFIAYGQERSPERLEQWSTVLREVLSDAGAELEDDDLESSAARVVQQLAQRGVLQVRQRALEPGELVLAVLPEDEDWHPAIVTAAEGADGMLQINFFEYGRPYAVAAQDVRLTADVVDDEEGELQEGDCEMCTRHLLLTFHHLIPKDKHPTYLGKRLPRGIEGEPTRGFLNTYGLMICRQCHNTVHRLASNEVLAAEYNTLAKIMEQPMIQRWVEWAKKQYGRGIQNSNRRP